MNRFCLIFILLTTWSVDSDCRLDAQDKTGESVRDKSPSDLVRRHQLLATQIQLLEEKLIRLSQFESDRNKERAELLKKSLTASQNAELHSKLLKTLALVEKGNTTDLKTAIENQKQILMDLTKVYEMLESGSAIHSNKSAKEKLRQKVHRLEQMIRQQESARQQLDSGDFDRIGGIQKKIKESTQKIKNEIQSENETESALPEKNDTENSDSKGKSADGKNAPAQNSNETNSASKPQQVIQKLQTAEKQMDAAQKSLETKDETKAGNEMEQATQELASAKQKLENILKQNREEEIESVLRSIEERLKFMLQMQLKINRATRLLVESEDAENEKRIKSFALSGDQRKVILRAEKMLLILKEEGSSRAISGTVSHAKQDMVEIVNRLELGQFDDQTIELQEDVELMLSELIKSVQQEQDDQKNLKAQNGPAQKPVSGETERPLVQKIAELKIIKQLQVRINDKHRSFSERMKKSPDDLLKKDLIRRTKLLSDRQEQLEKMTWELIEGAQQ